MMQREAGEPGFPIWLLGDSNPDQWEAVLKTPLDPRHPIRHNIWTPILEVIQDRVFRNRKSRVDTSTIYIRNVVDSTYLKPSPSANDWEKATENRVNELRELLRGFRPQLVLCFGAFSFEFARRSLNQEPKRNYGYWGAKKLGEEFCVRNQQFDPNTTNVLPLLHRSISGGKFIESHDYFCGETGANYFELTGITIADKLLQYHDCLRIWID